MNVTQIVESRQGENYSLHRQYVNPTLARVLQMIGHDIIYAKGEGCHLYDVHGEQYLDFLGGHGVFHLGRNYPHVRRVIHGTLESPVAQDSRPRPVPKHGSSMFPFTGSIGFPTRCATTAVSQHAPPNGSPLRSGQETLGSLWSRMHLSGSPHGKEG